MLPSKMLLRAGAQQRAALAARLADDPATARRLPDTLPLAREWEEHQTDGGHPYWTSGGPNSPDGHWCLANEIRGADKWTRTEWIARRHDADSDEWPAIMAGRTGDDLASMRQRIDAEHPLA